MDEEGTLEGDWSLCAMESTPGKHSFARTRDLTEDERASIPLAMTHLRGFSGEALTGPLDDALTELVETLDQLPSGAAHYGRQVGEFRSRLNGRLSAYLTAFSGLRVAVERHARELDLPNGGVAPALFNTLYMSDMSFRFVWMLRNLDQHRPPASSVLGVVRDEDPETGERRARPTIDVLAVTARCAAESSIGRRAQWEECAALWEGQTEPVDARALFRDARNKSLVVVARHLREAEPLILDDAVHISRLIAEVEPWGAAKVIAVADDGVSESVDLRILDLNLHTLSEALTTLETTRRMLNEPSLRTERLLPDDFPFFGNSIGASD